jgi:plasmid stability protein
MANVFLRDIPEEVLNRLKDMAKAHNRSLQQELRVVLENMAVQTLPDVFQKTSELRKELRKKAIRFTDSAKLLREDRLR